MQQHASLPIGVFDSGVGGLTVVRAVLEKLPHEKVIYLGDTARLPYGNRSQSTILRYAQNAADFLLKQQVKMILVACNTASAAAMPTLTKTMSVPVLGAVDPGATAAARETRTGVIGVLATRATTGSRAYPLAIAKQNPTLQIFGQACPLLVPFIEEGWLDESDPLPREVVRRYLQSLFQQSPDIDTLVLGCTHYGLLGKTIQQVANEVWHRSMRMVDSASTMADETLRILQQQQCLASNVSLVGPLSDRLRCFVTDEARVAEIGATFLGKHLDKVELVDL